jgi:tellurite resistance protein TehA-like permease
MLKLLKKLPNLDIIIVTIIALMLLIVAIPFFTIYSIQNKAKPPVIIMEEPNSLD